MQRGEFSLPERLVRLTFKQPRSVATSYDRQIQLQINSISE